jgi:ParE toxin of type II toxin-antitoxin system, parDE
VANLVWSKHVLDLMAELPPEQSTLIFSRAHVLQRFPRLYPIRSTGRFRRYRRLLAGNWMVYYRVVDDTVYIRAIWPAVIP